MKGKPPDPEMGYSKAAIDLFSPGRLWQEFGLHRGVLEERRYYFLGDAEWVGALSGQYRMLFHPVSVDEGKLKSMDPLAPLQGPVLGDRADPDIQSAFSSYVEPVKAYLNSAHTPRPRLKLKGTPTLNFADRPDVGLEPAPVKAKIKFRQPEARKPVRLPIKGRPTA